MWLHVKKEKKALLITTCVCVCVCGVGGCVWVCMWICAFVCVFFLFFLFTFYVLVCSLLGWLLQCQFTLEPWAALKKKIIIINKIPQYQFTLEPQRLGNKKKIVNKIPQCQLMSGSENKNKKKNYFHTLRPSRQQKTSLNTDRDTIITSSCVGADSVRRRIHVCQMRRRIPYSTQTATLWSHLHPLVRVQESRKCHPPPLTLHHRLSAFALILRRH